ncbi:asparagine synthase (glutamine-hydrolyzing) [Rurimicrobium arvi]|uniref:asparagine synthase (glutamine-hydrolyzing) n=1 Tax=Rurimicrobium arvi TaxID=2049916 RepID=A0ABP8MNL2_9BACT
MCGIFGAVVRRGADEAALKAATDQLQRRGPDAGGYYLSEDKRTFLGHRRLSIIDTSHAADQPMFSADGRFVIVYNGELYNFAELKSKLPQHHWRTSSDTEVLLELFARFGSDCFPWLNGIFAFAIYDTAEQKIFLCRDHLGIKPLFVFRTGDTLMFASELKAIVRANSRELTSNNFMISRKAVASFLHLGYIPEPMTIFRGVKKFPAGSFGVYDINAGTWDRKTYWDADNYYLRNPLSQESAVLPAFRDLLFASVERQMISDVPLGTFLSGGIDSSLVTALASKIAPKPVNTFSIGFEDPKHDESVFAEQIAKHLRTNHHTFKVSVQDVLDIVPDFFNLYDEPFADSSAFPTMLVSKLARQHVTVTLSGDGGDELFQGYGMYTWANRLSNPAVQVSRKLIGWGSSFMAERYQRAGLVANYPNSRNKKSHIFSQEQYLFSEREVADIMLKNTFDFSKFNEPVKRGTAAEQQAFWDLNHYLKDDLLVKVDRASMHYSLETRVPLLDKELVQFALNVPYDLKVSKELGTKHLMKRVLYELVPEQYFQRPKRGFSVPLASWLRNELRPMIEELLTQQQVDYAGLVSYRRVKALTDAFLGGKTYLYNRVWALLVLHLWKKTNNF